MAGSPSVICPGFSHVTACWGISRTLWPDTLGTGANDTIVGGIGANQVLTANGAYATITDGSGAVNQVIHATGGNDTVNLGSALSETVWLGGSTHNTINVHNADTTMAIHGITATDNITFANTSGVTVTAITGGEQLSFGNGQVADLYGTHAALSAAIHYF
jgi:hypothetical protein